MSIAWSFVGYFLHELYVEPPTVVGILDGDKFIKVNRQKKATAKRPDLALNRLNASFLGPFVNNQTEAASKARLIGSLRSHRSGTRGSTEEEQLTNLWTAIETISGTTPEQNIISHICSVCMPVLCLTYAKSILGSLVSDLLRCVLPELRASIEAKKPPDMQDDVFWVKFVTSSEFSDERQKIYDDSDELMLLKYRLFRVREMLIKPYLMRSMVLEHEQRLRWHLERIYRARNILIHSGTTVGSYLPSLVMNLHSYVDTIISALVEKLHRERHKVSLEKVLYEYKMDYESYIRRLGGFPKEGEHPDLATETAAL